ncbi:uncharacterized protein LOC122788688 [Protopterus annectens]|uniref:uncharacterized protein LOC122788688 n=1 Tax=Protopterus annectens TaxID=7888 RepID=UPI001CFB9B2E|nr:uncharacterized protein LOC122788688 [Protopterus annectens]
MVINEELYNFLKIDGVVTPIFKGLPKIHKSLNDPPLRPIVSGRKWVTENASIWLETTLRPFVDSMDNILTDTGSFLKALGEVERAPPEDLYLMVTLDVQSLFTVINNEYGVTAISQLLKANDVNDHKIGLFKTMLSLVLENNAFLGPQQLYRQAQGVAKCTPCANTASDSKDEPLANLRPRHHELIRTPCGPVKSWSELTTPLKVYYSLAILSLLVLLSVTIWILSKQNENDKNSEEDFAFSLIQLIGIVFCIYYVTRGILQESQQELVVFGLSVLLLMIRSVVNFAVVPSKDRTVIMVVRFTCVMVFGCFHLICASVILFKRQNMMAFRVGGALESLQRQYYMLNLCFSMLTFDLQAQLCLCVLMLVESGTSHVHSIILGVGILWSCLTAAVGIISVIKEVKALVWLFVLQNLPELAYLVYLLYYTAKSWAENGYHVMEAAAITGSIISLVIKSVLFWSIVQVYRSFGQGLRERMFSSYGTIAT